MAVVSVDVLPLHSDLAGRFVGVAEYSLGELRWACVHGDPRLYSSAVEGRADAVVEFESSTRDAVVSTFTAEEVGGCTIGPDGGVVMLSVAIINGSSYEVASGTACGGRLL